MAIVEKGSGSRGARPNRRSRRVEIGRKIRGSRIATQARANNTSGTTGASTFLTQARLTTKTTIPDRAERSASRTIDARIVPVAVSPVSRSSAVTRAAGVHTPPGTYFASIETISDWSAARYDTRMFQPAR